MFSTFIGIFDGFIEFLGSITAEKHLYIVYFGYLGLNLQYFTFWFREFLGAGVK